MLRIDIRQIICIVVTEAMVFFASGAEFHSGSAVLAISDRNGAVELL